MSNFKQYKFKSYSLSEIVVAINILKQLGYKTPEDFFDLAEAVEGGGLCTWDGGYITEGYLYFGTDHEDITLEELNAIVSETSSVSGEQSLHNAEVSENKVYDIFVKIPNEGWKKLDSYPVETHLSSQYKHLIGVQFNKNIYSFNDKRYVHNVGRDKDGDVCVVDQYGVDYKLRDVEFYISDEHEDTLVYEKYIKWSNL